MRWARPLVMAVAVGLLAVFLVPGGASAQDGASLERVEELTRLGRTEEARGLLTEWWEGERLQASRRDRQRGIWLRGRLTVDPSQAELDFRRLVIEYPGGSFSDRALLRLAQGAWAQGRVEMAERHLEQLARDYPGSPVVREATTWRNGAGPAPEVAPAPVSPAQEAPSSVAGEVAGAGPPPQDAAEEGAPVAEEGSPTDTTAAAGSFAVQLGAFAGEGRARALQDRVAAAGFEARLVRVEGSRLLHVRVGRFVEVSDAEDLLAEIRGLGLTAALVRDAHREEGVS